MPGKWNSLDAEDLVMNKVYEASSVGIGGEQIHRLLPVGNRGGFRYAKRRGAKLPSLVALSATGKVNEWPDKIDWDTGQLTYWGDNRDGSTQLEKTKKGGNALLAKTFRFLHYGKRESIPPYFLFEDVGRGRDVVFRGLLVPGGTGLGEGEDLIAEWREGEGGKFQNYRATFTILRVPRINKGWVADLKVGVTDSQHTPLAWSHWVQTGKAEPWLVGPEQS